MFRTSVVPDGLVLPRRTPKPLHKDHGAGEDDAECDQIAQTDQEDQDAQHGSGPLRHEGWAYVTDCPVVVAARAHHRSGRHYPGQADPEEGGLMPRIVGAVVVQALGYLTADRLLRRSQCGVRVQLAVSNRLIDTGGGRPGTRTRMSYLTRPSNVRVYQFRQPPGCSRLILPKGLWI